MHTQPDIHMPRPQAIGIYTAILTQEDTGAPTATIMHNTTGAEITWTRTLEGLYKGTLSTGTFITDLSWVIIKSIPVNNNVITAAAIYEDNYLQIFQIDNLGASLDGFTAYIEIRIYNQATINPNIIPEIQKPYKIYTGLVTQTSTDAPTDEILQNTLGGTITWTRDSEGTYIATGTGLFTAGYTKTAILIGSPVNTGYSITGTWWSNNEIYIQTPTDGQLNLTTIEIRVYN